MAGYTPKDPTTITTLDELKDFVNDELGFVGQQFGAAELVNWLRPVAVPPDKPRQGMIAYADGANWNPGSGEGSYEYTGGAIWRPLYNPVPVVHTPFVNILDHGGVADGVADNTAALTASVAALGPTGGTIYFPQGKYAFGSQQTINYPLNNAVYDVTLLGDGNDASVLYWV